MTNPYPLGEPIGAVMRPVEPLLPEESLQLAADRMRDEGLAVLPVVENGRFAGVVTLQTLVGAIGAMRSPLEPVSRLMDRGFPVVPVSATAADGLRRLAETRAPALVVVDEGGMPFGLFSVTDLVSPPEQPVRPRFVGGMATPFGVYLTNGTVSGGVPKWAIVATGALLFTLFVAANLISGWVGNSAVTMPLEPSVRAWLLGALALGLFMIGIRLLPLSGIHAAEHMVVHAIERGESLTPEVVSRMPRVHPRCGTNLAAGATLFLVLMNTSLIADQELRLLVAVLVTVIFWRPLGSLLQYFVTTRPPSRRHIDLGITAGRELLDRYQRSPHAMPSVGHRLWNSGLVQIILGSTLASFLLEGIAWAVGRHDWVRVYF